MVFVQAFIHSMTLPAKHSLKKLSRISMDYTVVYLFILIAILSLPAFIAYTQITSGFIGDMNLFFLLMYFFIFYYLPLTIFIFVMLTGLTALGKWLCQLLHRKIRFGVLWKLNAYTTTIPFLIYFVISLIYPINQKWVWLFLFINIPLQVKMITIYPRRKIRH